MIYFKNNIKDFKLYLSDLFWYTCKLWVIIDIFILPAGIYYLLKGINDKGLALYFGIFLLFCGIIGIQACIRIYISYKKSLKIFFQNANENGDVEKALDVVDDTLVIKNLSIDTVDKIKISHIKKIIKSNHLIILITTYKKALSFPKTNELEKFFDSFKN